jgi:hypothetical protein
MADKFLVADAMDAGMTPDEIHQFVTENGLEADTTGLGKRHASFASRLGNAHAGQTARAKRTLSTGQVVAKGVADWMPPVFSGVGALSGGMGGGAAAGLPAIPGAMWGGTQGALLGQAGKESVYNMAGIPKDNGFAQTASRYAASGAEGLFNGLFQGVGGAPSKSLAVAGMKSAVGSAQPLVEEKMVRRGIEATAKGKRMAEEFLIQARTQKKALLEHMNGPDGVRTSWKHFRETLANAARNAAEADPLSATTENAIQIALARAKHKMSTIFAEAARRRGDMPFAGRGSEDAVLAPRQVEAIRRFADNQVRFYERLRLGKTASGPSAEPSPLEGAYKLIADRARGILNEFSDPNTGRTLREINADIGDYSDIQEAITQVMKRSPSRDVATAAVATSPTLAYGLWRHDPAAIGLSLLTPAATFMATNPGMKSRLALNLARQSAGRGLAAQAIPQAAGAFANLAGMGNPDPTRGIFNYTSPADATVRPAKPRPQ